MQPSDSNKHNLEEKQSIFNEIEQMRRDKLEGRVSGRDIQRPWANNQDGPDKDERALLSSSTIVTNEESQYPSEVALELVSPPVQKAFDEYQAALQSEKKLDKEGDNLLVDGEQELDKQEKPPPMEEATHIGTEECLKEIYNCLSDLPPAEAFAELEKAKDQLEQMMKILSLTQLNELPDDSLDLTARGTVRKRRRYKAVGSDVQYVKLAGTVPLWLSDEFGEYTKSANISKSQGITEAIELVIKINQLG